MSRPSTRCPKCGSLNRHESGETEITCKNCDNHFPTSEEVSNEAETTENRDESAGEGSDEEVTEEQPQASPEAEPQA